MSSLKPCPKCGKKPSIMRAKHSDECFVVCFSEPPFGFAGKTLEEAARKWNEADEETPSDDLP